MKHYPLKTWLRCLLTAPLLGVAWMHSHWSVALILTLLSVANELNSARAEALHKLTGEIANQVGFLLGYRR